MKRFLDCFLIWCFLTGTLYAPQSSTFEASCEAVLHDYPQCVRYLAARAKGTRSQSVPHAWGAFLEMFQGKSASDVLGALAEMPIYRGRAYRLLKDASSGERGAFLSFFQSVLGQHSRTKEDEARLDTGSHRRACVTFARSVLDQTTRHLPDDLYATFIASCLIDPITGARLRHDSPQDQPQILLNLSAELKRSEPIKRSQRHQRSQKYDLVAEVRSALTHKRHKHHRRYRSEIFRMIGRVLPENPTLSLAQKAYRLVGEASALFDYQNRIALPQNLDLVPVGGLIASDALEPSFKRSENFASGVCLTESGRAGLRAPLFCHEHEQSCSAKPQDGYLRYMQDALFKNGIKVSANVSSTDGSLQALCGQSTRLLRLGHDSCAEPIVMDTDVQPSLKRQRLDPSIVITQPAVTPSVSVQSTEAERGESSSLWKKMCALWQRFPSFPPKSMMADATPLQGRARTIEGARATTEFDLSRDVHDGASHIFLNRVKRTATQSPIPRRHANDRPGLLEDLGNGHIEDFKSALDGYITKYTHGLGYKAPPAILSMIMSNLALKSGGLLYQFNEDVPDALAFDRSQWLFIPPAQSSLDAPILLMALDNTSNRNAAEEKVGVEELRRRISETPPEKWQKYQTPESLFFVRQPNRKFRQILDLLKQKNTRGINALIHTTDEAGFRNWVVERDNMRKNALDHLAHGDIWETLREQMRQNAHLQGRPVVRIAVIRGDKDVSAFKISHAENAGLFRSGQLHFPARHTRQRVVQDSESMSRTLLYEPGGANVPTFEEQKANFLKLFDTQSGAPEIQAWVDGIKHKLMPVAQKFASSNEDFFRMALVGELLSLCAPEDGVQFVTEWQFQDLVAFRKIGDTAVIFECKDGTGKNLQKTAEKGLKQAQDRPYGVALSRVGVTQVMRVGIAFTNHNIETAFDHYNVPNLPQERLTSTLSRGHVQDFGAHLGLFAQKNISPHDQNKRNPGFPAAFFSGMMTQSVMKGDFDQIYSLPDNRFLGGTLFLTSPNRPSALFCLELFKQRGPNAYRNEIAAIKGMPGNEGLESVIAFSIHTEGTSYKTRTQDPLPIEAFAYDDGAAPDVTKIDLAHLQGDLNADTLFDNSVVNLNQAERRARFLKFLDGAFATQSALFPKGGRMNEATLQGLILGALSDTPDIEILSANDSLGLLGKRPDFILKVGDKIVVIENKMTRETQGDTSRGLTEALEQVRRNRYGDNLYDYDSLDIVGLEIDFSTHPAQFRIAHDEKPYVLTDLPSYAFSRELSLSGQRTPERRADSASPVTALLSPPRKTPNKRPHPNQSVPAQASVSDESVVRPKHFCKGSRQRRDAGACGLLSGHEKTKLVRQIDDADKRWTKQNPQSASARLRHASLGLPLMFSALDGDPAAIGIHLGMMGLDTSLTETYSLAVNQLSSRIKAPKLLKNLQKSKVIFGEVPGGIADVVFYGIDAAGYIQKFRSGDFDPYDTGKFVTITVSFGASSAVSIAVAAGALSNPVALGATIAIVVTERLITSVLDAKQFMEGLTDGEVFDLSVRNFFGVSVAQELKDSKIFQEAYKNFVKHITDLYFGEDAKFFLATFPDVKQQNTCSLLLEKEDVQKYHAAICQMDRCCGRSSGDATSPQNSNLKFLDMFPDGFPVCNLCAHPFACDPVACSTAFECSGHSIMHAIMRTQDIKFAQNPQGIFSETEPKDSTIVLEENFEDESAISTSRLFLSPDGTRTLCAPTGLYPTRLATPPPPEIPLQELIPFYLDIPANSSFPYTKGFACGEGAPLRVSSKRQLGKNYCDNAVLLERERAGNATDSVYYFANTYSGVALPNQTATVIVANKQTPGLSLNFTGSDLNDMFVVFGTLDNLHLDGHSGQNTLQVFEDVHDAHYTQENIKGFSALIAAGKKPLSLAVRGDIKLLDLSHYAGHRADIDVNHTINVKLGQKSHVRAKGAAHYVYTLSSRSKESRKRRHHQDRAATAHPLRHEHHSVIQLNPSTPQAHYFHIPTVAELPEIRMEKHSGTEALRLHFAGQTVHLERFSSVYHSIHFALDTIVPEDYLPSSVEKAEQVYISPVFLPLSRAGDAYTPIAFKISGILKTKSSDGTLSTPIQLNPLLMGKMRDTSKDCLYTVRLEHENANEVQNILFKGGRLRGTDPHTVIIGGADENSESDVNKVVVDFSQNAQSITYELENLVPQLEIYSAESQNDQSWDVFSVPVGTRFISGEYVDAHTFRLVLQKGEETCTLTWHNIQNRHVKIQAGARQFRVDALGNLSLTLFGQFSSGVHKVYTKDEWQAVPSLTLPQRAPVFLHQDDDVVLFCRETQGSLALKGLYGYVKEHKRCPLELYYLNARQIPSAFVDNILGSLRADRYFEQVRDRVLEGVDFFEQPVGAASATITLSPAQSVVKIAPQNTFCGVSAHNGTLTLETRHISGEVQWLNLLGWDQQSPENRPLIWNDKRFFDVRDQNTTDIVSLLESSSPPKRALGPFSGDTYINLLPFEDRHLLTLYPTQTGIPSVVSQRIRQENGTFALDKNIYMPNSFQENDKLVTLFYTDQKTVRDISSDSQTQWYTFGLGAQPLALEGRALEAFSLAGLHYLSDYADSVKSDGTQETSAFFTIPVLSNFSALPQNICAQLAHKTFVTFATSLSGVTAQQEGGEILLRKEDAILGRVGLLNASNASGITIEVAHQSSENP